MSRGQEKNFSTLGPKLSESKAQQNYGDKSLQTRVQVIDYKGINRRRCLKKNWNIELDLQSILTSPRLLLNHEYEDLSLEIEIV